MARQLYWDTSVFLCFLNREEETRRRICEDILQHASMEDVHILTSTYTIVEVIRPKRKSIAKARQLTPGEIGKIKQMFRWPFITTIELDERTALFASDLARDHNLAPADAVQAASAILWKVDALQAWDRDFSAVSHQVAVEEPYFLSAQPMLEGIELPNIGPTPDDFKE
jgi:predicted nucleic acid-binding protein